MKNDINKKLIKKLIDKHGETTAMLTMHNKICFIICELRKEYGFTYALIVEYIKEEYDLTYSNTKIARCLKKNNLVNTVKRPNSTVKTAKTPKKDHFSEDSKKTTFQNEASDEEEELFGEDRIVEKGMFKGMTIREVRAMPHETNDEGKLTEKSKARLKVLSDYF